jgi:hypothetical protein
MSFRAPEGTLPKPPHGSPCNGCGRCCLESLCPLGEHLFEKQEGPCPALQPAGQGRWECGVIIQPGVFALVQTLRHGAKRMSAAAALLLGAGHGCDAIDNEPVNEAFEARQDAYVYANAEAAVEAQLMWVGAL